MSSVNNKLESNCTPDPTRTVVPLASGYGLEVAKNDDVSSLQLVAPNGLIFVSICIDARGPSIQIRSPSISVVADNTLCLSGDRVSIDAQSEITMRSSVISMRADSALVTEGREQRHVSTHGDYIVKANDDVIIDGERIGLNSPPMMKMPPLIANMNSTKSPGK